MEKLSSDIFEQFHARFCNGDCQATFQVCSACGEPCEYNLMAPLLPGEAEFIASKLQMPVDAFRDRYLDGVMNDGIVLDLLKCVDPCQFLNDAHECTIQPFKPVLCKMYPIEFCPDPETGAWVAVLDRECALANHPTTKAYFEQEGMQAVNQLPVSPAWLERAYKLFLHFNYQTMAKDRNLAVEQYKLYQIEELLAYSYVN